MTKHLKTSSDASSYSEVAELAGRQNKKRKKRLKTVEKPLVKSKKKYYFSVIF